MLFVFEVFVGFCYGDVDCYCDGYYSIEGFYYGCGVVKCWFEVVIFCDCLNGCWGGKRMIEVYVFEVDFNGICYWFFLEDVFVGLEGVCDDCGLGEDRESYGIVVD